MPGFKRVVMTAVAAAVIACTSIAPAQAGPHGYGHLHPWGLGRGLFGAVFGLATLPLAIASAAIEASVPEAPAQPNYAPPPQNYYAPQPQAYYAPPAPAYYPRPAYYAPPAYYAAPRAYYAPPAPVYYSAPRTYYAPRANYAPRPRNYAGAGGYHAGGYAYTRR
ncbi:MAG: hypothetical protein WA803_22065 [Steroidobacteraceae bacterium]